MTAGWGVRHPAILEILRSATAVGAVTTRWDTLSLRVSAYTPLVELPDDLVTSVRCIVTVNDAVVMCTNRGGTHPWPGGRRERGETFAQTARREVLEETGWILDPATVRPLGWLHLEHLERPPDDYPYPHPDFLQIVTAARAERRIEGGGSDWTDTDGYETTAFLVPLQDVTANLSGDRTAHLAEHFLALL
jgi:NUDIX domain-containing protein